MDKFKSDINHLGKYFYQLAERSQDIFWIRDKNFTNVLYINPAYEKIWGLTCASLYEDSTSWEKKVVDEDKERLQLELKAYLEQPEGDEGYKIAFRINPFDNEIRQLHAICFRLYDADHQLTGYAGIVKDVTQSQERLVELENASRYFRYFAERVNTVYWVRDPNDKQIYVSPAYEKVWGRSCEELYSRPGSWIETLIEEDRPPHEMALRYAKVHKRDPFAEFEHKYRIKTLDGEVRWIKDTSFAIHENNQFLGFFGIAEDITREVLDDQALREAKQRAEAANRAKSDFLAMVSHELRTPLNAILGMAQILTIKGVPVELQEYVDIISNAGNSLLSLVGDILDFARLEEGKLTFSNEPFEMIKLLNQVVQSLQHQAQEKKIQLILDYPTGLPSSLMGDANRIRQVLMNLLSNAIKFTDKGFVKVVVRYDVAANNTAIFNISVIDTGYGIPEDKIEKLFQKFSQVDSIYSRKHGGIGLGLAITKQLIDVMGGSIQVFSELGKGSEFKIILPFKMQAVQEKKLELDVNRHWFPLETKADLNVLLIEDNLVNQKIAKIMLEDFGCTVDVVDNGQAVLEIKDTLPKYDVIFMDIGLPDISGFELVSQLRQESYLKEMPIIAMTAHVLDRDRQRAIEAGMDSVVAKPISYDELAAILKKIVQHRVNYKKAFV